MVGSGGLMASAKLCDSCKSASATVFCRADTAYLCISCDAKVHAANKLASRHARVWVCEVCEQSPATVTCKADAAHLCPTCDRDIHSANPLARRHDRVPLTPFFDPLSPPPQQQPALTGGDHTNNNTSTISLSSLAAAKSAAFNKLFGEDYYSDADEAEAASWLLPNPNKQDEPKSIDYLFTTTATTDTNTDAIDPYLDLDFVAEPKPDPDLSADGVVPDPDSKGTHNNIHEQPHHQLHHQASLFSLSSFNNHRNGHFDGFETNTNNASADCKPYSLSSFSNQPSLSHSVNSPSSFLFVVRTRKNATNEYYSRIYDHKT